MIDTHAHLHDEAFDEDRAAVLARAQAAGLHMLVNIGTDLVTSRAAIDASNTIGAGVAIGFHPHEAIEAPADLRAAFAPLIASANHLVAIGEIGLDYHYDHSPRDIQRAVLRDQLLLAAEYDLPVIFHEREALDDFVAILRSESARRQSIGQPQLRGVIHCFTRDTSAARIYTEEFGLFLGIGGVITFKTAQGLRDAVAGVGLSHIVLETDCPYLAPVPFRGKRNEPAFMAETVKRIAEVVGRQPDQVIESTTTNARRLFALPHGLSAC